MLELLQKLSIYRPLKSLLFVFGILLLAAGWIVFQTKSRNFDYSRKSSPVGMEKDHTKNDGFIHEDTLSGALNYPSLESNRTLPKKYISKKTDNTFNIRSSTFSYLSPLDKFSIWIDKYEELNCSIQSGCSVHDPRRISSFLKLGKKLARERKKEMAQLIQNDPRQALARAILPAIRAQLPSDIQQYVESHHNDLVDIHSLHTCQLDNHTTCKEEKIITTSEGTFSDFLPLG